MTADDRDDLRREVEMDLWLSRWFREVGGRWHFECSREEPKVVVLDVPGAGRVRHRLTHVALRSAYSRWRRAQQQEHAAAGKEERASRGAARPRLDSRQEGPPMPGSDM